MSVIIKIVRWNSNLVYLPKSVFFYKILVIFTQELHVSLVIFMKLKSGLGVKMYDIQLESDCV